MTDDETNNAAPPADMWPAARAQILGVLSDLTTRVANSEIPVGFTAILFDANGEVSNAIVNPLEGKSGGFNAMVGALEAVKMQVLLNHSAWIGASIVRVAHPQSPDDPPAATRRVPS